MLLSASNRNNIDVVMSLTDNSFAFIESDLIESKTSAFYAINRVVHTCIIKDGTLFFIRIF